MSLFRALYAYRQTESKNQQENYLTELLAFVLEHDEIFRTKFLKLFVKDDIIPNNISVKIKTQTPRKFGADIIVKACMNDKPIWILHIENKIWSEENWNPKEKMPQLDTYDEVLKEENTFEKKYLFFLTLKPWEQGDRIFSSMFAHRRWHQVYKELETMDFDVLSTTRQFKEYLEAIGFDKSHQFETLDNFEYYGKYNYILDEVLDFAKKERGNRFEEGDTISRKHFEKNHKFYNEFSFLKEIGLHIGFAKEQFHIDKPHIYIFINKGKLGESKWQELNTKLEADKWYKIDENVWFGKYLLLSELSKEE